MMAGGASWNQAPSETVTLDTVCKEANGNTFPVCTERQEKSVKLNSSNKFHISNFYEKKKSKKKHRDKERKESAATKPNLPNSSKQPSTSNMISSLYGTQHLELKPTGSDNHDTKTPNSHRHKRQKHDMKSPCKSTASLPESVPNERFVSKAKVELSTKEPYLSEYHVIKRYISTDITGEFAKFLHVEVHTNGGGLVLHSYQDEIDTLPVSRRSAFVDEFMKLAFLEDENQQAYFIMAIVHNSAHDIPDLIDYLAEKHPNMTAKMGMLGKSDIETVNMSEVKEKIYNTYSCGTYRAGPLLQLSLVGLAQEEVCCLLVICVHENRGSVILCYTF